MKFLFIHLSYLYIYIDINKFSDLISIWAFLWYIKKTSIIRPNTAIET